MKLLPLYYSRRKHHYTVWMTTRHCQSRAWVTCPKIWTRFLLGWGPQLSRKSWKKAKLWQTTRATCSQRDNHWFTEIRIFAIRTDWLLDSCSTTSKKLTIIKFQHKFYNHVMSKSTPLHRNHTATSIGSKQKTFKNKTPTNITNLWLEHKRSMLSCPTVFSDSTIDSLYCRIKRVSRSGPVWSPITTSSKNSHCRTPSRNGCFGSKGTFRNAKFNGWAAIGSRGHFIKRTFHSYD